MNLYYSLLKAFLNKDLYLRYKDYVDFNFIKENYPEVSKLFFCLQSLHEGGSDEKSVDDLELALLTLYPATSQRDYQPIFTRLRESTVESGQVKSYLEGIKQRSTATEIAKIALAVGEGTKEFSELQNALQGLEEQISVESDVEEGLITDDIEEINRHKTEIPGLSWPLASLNENLGPIRQGDFGFVFARPETGKTTFLATVTPFMASQTDRPILWLNNEEQGEKVVKRLYQSALGWTDLELEAKAAEARAKYYELTKRNIKFYWITDLTKQRVEELCKKHNPALIIYDQIDKIQGFHKEERNDLDLKAIYVWARQLAQQYAPSIAICQAGASGEGKRWLTMGDVDNSKTGKQGEADWILGIGKVQDEGLESVRYLHLSKNKLKGIHAKWEVRIRPEIARYEDF